MNTPETDAAWQTNKNTVFRIETSRRLERERNEARAEMIRWMSIAEGRGRSDEVTELELGLRENRDLWSSNAELAEQRDGLAEALQQCREDSVELLNERDRVAAAIKSINQPEL